MTNENVELSLLRGAVIPTAITGALAMGLSVIVSGMAGFLGALLAQFIVVIFFAVTIFVSRISRNLDPISTMGLALFSYTTKLLFVGVFFVASNNLHRSRKH